MKYVILIYGNPESRRMWAEMSDAERAPGFDAYKALNEELAASGELIVTEALADPALMKRVTVRDAQTMTGDGPMAEAKELLAGFFLVDCESIDRAIEIAARIPEADLGLVEVRPVMTYSELE